MELNKLNLMSMASQKMKWLSERQKVIAENVANADTPGYKAKDTVDFETYLSGSSTKVAASLTHPDHIVGRSIGDTKAVIDKTAWSANPNGNTVILEQQSMKAAEIRESYDLATNLYKKSFDLLRTVVAGGR